MSTRTIELKKVMTTFKGDYNSSTTYLYADVVKYNGSSYALKVESAKGVQPTDTNKWQLLVEKPVKGVDYFTTSDKQEMVEEITEDADSEFNQNVQEKTQAFNQNASDKTTTFNENATSKTTTFNSNASAKQDAYDENHTTKLGAYNTNDINKTTAFNDNATTKTTAFNTNAQEKIDEYDEHVAEMQTSIDDLEERVENIEKATGHIYGIKRKITDNSSPEWERIYDSVSKVATATKDGTPVQNDFDILSPWIDIKSCNYDLTLKKVNAWIGDPDFKFDGTNGDVFTHIPKTYWKIYQENDYDYVLLSDYPRTGFMEVDGFFISRYNGTVIDDVLHSYSGLVPTTNKTRAQFRTLANALGDNFSQLDWRYFVLQMLYLVEYATYNSQLMLGNGIMNRKYEKTIVAENNTNRAIVATATGYYVGQTIRIGTSDGGIQVADARKITAIESYDDGTVTGFSLTFDGATVNIAVDNFVSTMAQETGQCDSLEMKSGCLNNDGYHSVIYRGVENIYANIWQFIDGINIKDRLAYICKDPSVYADNVFANPYKPLAYTNVSANGYEKTLGLDVNEPFFRFPTSVGGDSSNYMTDYYNSNAGNMIARVGGSSHNGAYAGLWSWSFNGGPSSPAWNFGSRVVIDNQ